MGPIYHHDDGTLFGTTFAGGPTHRGTVFKLAPPVSERLTTLRDQVRMLNSRSGIQNSLDAKLRNVEQALTDVRNGNAGAACGSIGAFIAEVTAQSDKSIAAADAGSLLAVAHRIRAALGCS